MHFFQLFLVILSLQLLCLLPSLGAQMDPHSANFSAKIDSIFSDRADTSAPGASVIIMKDGCVAMARSYGAAQLSCSVPFEKGTVFPLEGFTEQLVVFALLQLEQKGLIRLDDPINMHLPELGFLDGVTLSHFLNHSSDLPMLSSLRLLAGWRYSDPFTQDDFLALTKKVSIAARPDQELVHNHGGIKILMMVIEEVTKSSFVQYATANIFSPLGMPHTTIGSTAPINHRSSVGYTETKEGLVTVAPVPFEVFCPDTYTTQSDFIRWMEMVHSKAMFVDIIEKMDESLTIRGKPVERSYGSYCLGQQQYRHYLGQDEFYMRSTDNGYSWMWLRLSQAEVSVMVVSNLDTYIGSKVNAIADILGEYDSRTSLEKSADDSVTVVPTQEELKLCTGIYWNEDYMYTTEITLKGDTLYHADDDNGFHFMLTPISSTLFLTPFGGTVEFTQLEGRERRMTNIIPNGRSFRYKLYSEPIFEGANQLKYEGVYTSDELDVFYRITWEDDTLILKRDRKPDLALSPIGGHRYRTQEIDFRLLTFEEAADKSIQAMTISNPSIRDFSFYKL